MQRTLFVLLCDLLLVFGNPFTFTLPKTQTTSEKQLDQDIKDIFLSGSDITGRFGDNNVGGYSGQTAATLDPNDDVLLQLIQGSASVGKSPAPADYNLNSLTQAAVEKNTQYENCADYTEEFGYECVPYYQCSNGSIITDGAGLIDIRNGFAALNPEDSKCPGFLDVCCKDPDFVPPPPQPRYESKCGRRNINGVGARIQGFTEGESQFGEWPHMCAILEETLVNGETQKQFQCGASLIDTGIVLTAAHCLDKFRNDVSKLIVRCGEWDTQHTTEPYPHQDVGVESIQIHPEFNPRNLANDFAVMFLKENFVLDFNIDTVCLPEPGQNFDGSTCFATGWGKDEFGADGRFQVVLKEIEIPTVDSNTCQAKLRSTRLGQRFRLDPSFMCAGGVPGKDTCKGDGGGPLVCATYDEPDTYRQAGIVAWGIGCGGDTPGVYAEVSKAVCWIDLVTSCRSSGGQYSHFGFTTSQCGSWLADTKQRLQALPARIRGSIEAQYNQCTVSYYDEQTLDISQFARVKQN